ncbi:MAG: DUF3754 domain-containing protein [Pseudomonadota bacterium]
MAKLSEELPEGETRDAFDTLARRLTLLFHIEFFELRERLKELYLGFNPDQPGKGALPADPPVRAAFLETLEEAIQAANFRALEQDELLPAQDAAGRVNAQVRVTEDGFDVLRFYGRGRRGRSITVPKLFGLRRETVEAPVFEHVILVAGIDPVFAPAGHEADRLRPGGIYLKLFRDIPQADLRTLYPNARVVMSVRDKLILGVPALAGGVPILLNIVPALSVLLVVVGAYLGIAGTVEEDAVKQALAALSGLGALGGFLLRQWVKYERQKLRYQKQVAENAYFNSVTNNAGFFDMLIGASEDSEVKEALLAYALLRRAGEPLTQAELDHRIERWLHDRFGAEVDFEIDDAIDKLAKLALIDMDGERLAAPPLSEALDRSDAAWHALSREALA